ncbi:aminotransferase class IV [Kitasatospora sp. NPDC054939]
MSDVLDAPAPPLLWSGAGRLETRTEPSAGPVLAADSWLVDEGRVRGYRLHWERFGRTARTLGADPAELVRFRSAVTARLPREGRWFPRVELTADRGLALRLRPAPPAAPTAVAWIADVADPRRRPAAKGPDLDALAALRARAARQGADEALLLDRRGAVAEGAFTTLFWWDGDHLCTAPEDGTVLPGITRRLILERARCLGLDIDYRKTTPDRLVRREVWLTSALHGIRTVTAWRPGGPAPRVLGRAEEWRGYLASCLEPLPSVRADLG